MAKRLLWTNTPAKKDYAAARNYLTMCIADWVLVEKIVAALGSKDYPKFTRRANDILRASGLELLPKTDPQVAKNIRRSKRGTPMSPVLIVVNDDLAHPLVIADGYHRICASYHIDPKTPVPCRFVHVDGEIVGSEKV